MMPLRIGTEPPSVIYNATFLLELLKPCRPSSPFLFGTRPLVSLRRPNSTIPTVRVFCCYRSVGHSCACCWLVPYASPTCNLRGCSCHHLQLSQELSPP